jgi:hypothetical protein
MPNQYSILTVDDTEINHKKNERKAKKALIAIAKLKKKGNLTPDEKIKLDNEDNWHRVLDPLYVNISVQIQTEKERELREKQKMKRNQRKFEEEEQRKQYQRKFEEEEEQRKRYQRKFEEEEQRKRYQRKFEEEEQQEVEQKPISKLEKKLNIEYNVLIARGDTKKSAKRKMQIKYHPDKNKDINATTKSQYVNNF